MSAQFKPVPTPVDDSAGLDRVFLALGKGVTRYLEAVVQKHTGRTVNVWDGVNGLGAVLEEHLKAAGVPNKRLPELLTARAVIDQARALDRQTSRRRVKR